MSFTNPLALILLGLLPVIAWVGWPRAGTGFRREVVSLAVRLAIALCLVLAVAGLAVDRRADRLAVVFLIDVSDSMTDADVLAAESYVRAAMAEMGPDDLAAVIAFGGEALVEQPVSPAHELGRLTSIPASNQTDIGEAIQLALALYPPDAARRMVILTDGADTVSGEMAAAGGTGLYETARLAGTAGVEVVVVPFVSQSGPDVLVREVSTPGYLREGERFNLDITLDSNEAAQVTVTVLAGDRVVYEGTQAVEAGVQTFSLPMQAGEAGFVRYRVQVTSAADSYYQNNELAAYAEVEGPPKVLVVAPPEGELMGVQGQTRPDEFTALASALTAAGFVIEQALPAELPSELVLLNEYAAIVLVDVPARQLSTRQMEALQQYVRDLGGGLVTVGGPTSYGVGGYFRTPLEETLPVDMQIKDEQRRPTLAMVFIIDHSGSMADTSGGVQKVEIAKEATIRSLELLSPTDRVGVIAFDDSASWVVPISGMDDVDGIIRAVGTIRPDGGTDIMAGVQAMAAVLPGDPASVKHVILLTDGGADPSGIAELIARMYAEYGITVSTVGVGADAAPFLKDLAEAGGGRYHFAADPATIPSIFTEETTLATRSYIIEEEFYPKLTSNSALMEGISETPPLYGYVGASVKDTAEMVLATGQGDPLLAVWQYGLGKAASFTSDASGRWAKDWVGWDGFSTFWSQVVGYSLASQTPSALDVTVEANGEQAGLVVDALGLAGETYLNLYEMEANIISPGGQVYSTTLQQTGPGRYEAAFTPGEQGAYLIRVTGRAEDEAGGTAAATIGWVQSYSPEYRSLEPDPAQAVRLANAAGGRVAGSEPGEAFAHTLASRRGRNPAWPWLLALAVILLPVDVGVRRLIVTRGDLARFGSKLAGRVSGWMRKPAAAQAQAERKAGMQALFTAKERSQKERPPAEASRVVMPPQQPVKNQPAGEAAVKNAGTGARTDSPANAKEPEGKPETAVKPGGASTASRLLEQKRKRDQ